MFKNYLTTALRILLRQKVYSGINVLGLTVGVTAALLILLYVSDELRYDNFHPDGDQIHRVTFRGKLEDQDFVSTLVGTQTAETMQLEIPEVQSVVRIAKWNTFPLRYEDKAFTEKQFLLADSNFFSFFNFELISGDKNEALNGPNKAVISEAAAKKYFDYNGVGDLSPIGKIMAGGSDGKRTIEITGIAKNPPYNSHINFDFVLSMESWPESKSNIWLNSAVLTYFKIHKEANINSVQTKLDEFVPKYCGPEIQQFLNLSMEEFLGQGGRIGLGIQPLSSIHLHSNILDELEPNGNIQYVYLFSAVAIFILILACINFMNLSTARSANRAKEIGIRKTIGALRTRLMGQFIMESFIYTILSFILAIGFTTVLLNPFNFVAGKMLTSDMLLQPSFIIGMIVLILIVGFLAGSYPSFYLTSFQPVEVLKGKIRAGMKSSGIRNGLVVFQFVISIALIICSLMVYNQVKYIQNKNLGFEKENIINLLHTVNLGENGEAFKTELLSYPDVLGASFANRLPPNIDWTSTFNDPSTGRTHLFAIYQMDYDHLQTMGYEMVKGRFFSKDFPSDSSAIILNETAARNLGITEPNGQKIKSFFNSDEGEVSEVIGILKDFNFETLKSAIRPMAIMPKNTSNYEMAIRISGNNVADKVERIEAIWKKFAPQTPFEFSFLDQNFDAKYRSEQQLSSVILIFTSLAIFIACLGLFGLAAFTAEQRSKEISIRKVMGATIVQIITLLSKDFAKLVVIAFLIAIPITWFTIDKWLQEFEYHIDFSTSVVLISGSTAICVALLTISFQALKAALGNPVNSLRSE